MPDIKIPEPLEIHLDIPLKVIADLRADVGARVNADVKADIDADVKADIDADATITLVGDPNRPVAAQVQLIGDPQRPVTAKVGLSMLLENLPILDKNDLFRMMKRRIRLPLNFRFGMSVFPLNLFGVDAVQFSLCGEPQLILDDYVPNAYERCEVECEPCQP